MKRYISIAMQNPMKILAAIVLLAAPVFAGPPLVCHPINIGSARSLPWTSTTWNLSGDEGYDVNHLVADTLALLRPDTPVLVRMETMRRAALYSQNNAAVARELLAGLAARATSDGRDAMAAFDYGYLIETYRQLELTFRMSRGGRNAGDWVNPAAGLDGYALVKQAIGMRGGDAEMEFAAALITTENSKQDYSEHAAKAKAGMKEDPLLAQNVVSHF
ncbi:MAG TPA: hypothetical protein VIH88_05995 [Candidatus Acidoferrales bacterium]